MPPEASRAADAAPPGPEQSLDASSIEKLRALDPSAGSSFVSRVMSTYLRSLATQVEALGHAHEAQDLPGVAAAAHALKSASASVGALAFSRVCAALEAAVREGRQAAVPGLVAEFHAHAARVEVAVQAQLGPALAGGPSA
jgi:HPt (histidine-containing phosphotransfer) domain-containing protein